MTAYKDFANIEPKSAPIRVAIAAVLRNSPDGRTEILAAWRSRQSIRGGVWEFPGGKIETGESATETAIRETREELGIDITVLRSVGVAEDIDPTQPREHHVVVELLLARSRNGDPTVKDRAWRWIPLGELDTLPWPKANGDLIRRLQEELAEAGAGVLPRP